ncbi:MAG: topoisomerase [bacterium]|nr:topoisomerase [bacterium]
MLCRRDSAGAFKAASNGAGWLHRLKEPPPDWTPPVKAPEKPKADADRLDRVYRGFLRALDLRPEHRAHLTGPERGLSGRQIHRRGYKTLPPRGRSAIARALVERFGVETVLSVPGFYVSDRGPGSAYITFAGAPGILILFLDVEDRVVGLQIRPDKRWDGGGKYVWFSSKSRSGGTGPGGVTGLPAHVSRPRTRKGGRVWITEGPIKADVASNILYETVVAVPGVTTWEAANVLGVVDKLKAESVVVAYDADTEHNDRVQAAQQALCRAISAIGKGDGRLHNVGLICRVLECQPGELLEYASEPGKD